MYINTRPGNLVITTPSLYKLWEPKVYRQTDWPAIQRIDKSSTRPPPLGVIIMLTEVINILREYSTYTIFKHTSGHKCLYNWHI